MLIHHFEAETQGFHRQHCRLTISIELVELTNSETAATNSSGGVARSMRTPAAAAAAKPCGRH